MDVIRLSRICPMCGNDAIMTLVEDADGQCKGRPVITCPAGHLVVGVYGDNGDPVFTPEEMR